MHPFRKYILNYTHIPLEDWQIIEFLLTKREYRKGEVILEEGKVCKHVYFLETGFLRFYVNMDGEEVSKFFTKPPYCFTSQRSFNKSIPAKESIATLEDSRVWEITKSDSDKLLKLESWSTFTRELVQEVQFFTEQILVEIQNQTAEERYIKLVEGGSYLLEKVPLKHLASYLGIAPQSLSRIRKKYMEQRKNLT